MEEYEQKYNFRFEEGTGAYITTHQREVEDTLRRKDSKRKDKRLEKKERIEDEKRRKHEELNKLKQLKKDEIMDKLRKAEFIAGNRIVDDKRLMEKVEKELKTEFIPELYDRAMDQMFNEKYYEVNNKGDQKVVNKKDIDMKLMNDEDISEEVKSEDSQMEEGEEESEDDNADGDDKQEKYARELAKQMKKQMEEKEEIELQNGYETWFACDGCQKAIEGGQFRFDCNTCDNFCFCEKCYKKNKTHLHKFNRQKVPVHLKPPTNSKELIAKAYMLCNQCGDCLLDASKSVFICKTCTSDFESGDVVYFCLKCKKADTHEHKLSKLRILPG